MKLFCSLVQSPEVTVGAVTVMSRLWLCVSGTTWYHCEAAKIPFLLLLQPHPTPVLLLTVPGLEETASETDKNLSKQGWDTNKVRALALLKVVSLLDLLKISF